MAIRPPVEHEQRPQRHAVVPQAEPMLPDQGPDRLRAEPAPDRLALGETLGERKSSRFGLQGIIELA